MIGARGHRAFVDGIHKKGIGNENKRKNQKCSYHRTR